jgi:hypothetical protein
MNHPARGLFLLAMTLPLRRSELAIAPSRVLRLRQPDRKTARIEEHAGLTHCASSSQKSFRKTVTARLVTCKPALAPGTPKKRASDDKPMRYDL